MARVNRGCHNISNTFKDSIKKECCLMVLPGNEIPAWFSYKNEGSSVWFKLPQFDGSNLNGMNVCIVYSSHLEKEDNRDIEVKLNNRTEGFSMGHLAITFKLINSRGDHLWQGHVSNDDKRSDSEDEMELTVNCGNKMTLKKTGVYLVYEQDEARLKGKGGLDNDDGAGPSCDDELQAKRLRFETGQQSSEENKDVA